jgi:hypothetical protein
VYLDGVGVLLVIVVTVVAHLVNGLDVPFERVFV